MGDPSTLGLAFRRHHIHLRATEVGAPPLVTAENAFVAFAPGSASFNVADDRIEQIARKKFADDGWIVIENDQFDMDISYDGETYLIEAWVR